MKLSELIIFAKDNGLDAIGREGNEETWEKVMYCASFAPFFYSTASLNFQSAYQSGLGRQWQDLSLIILWDRKPAALLPFSVLAQESQHSLGCFGMPVLAPLFDSSTAPGSRKKISQACLHMIQQLACRFSVSTWHSNEPFLDTYGFSDWYVAAMADGAVSRVQHGMYVDLQLPIGDIKKCFRKSYKALVTSGAKEWKTGVLESSNDEIWNEFKELHIKVAGRQTRSDETWRIHYCDIQQHRGFLVYLRNQNGEMVGAGFFNYTRDEGLYAVAAYDRALFDKPLGHVVQYRAIETLKNKNVRWYKLGNRCYPSDDPAPDKKEISIAEFKQGFATHLLPEFTLRHSTILQGGEK